MAHSRLQSPSTVWGEPPAMLNTSPAPAGEEQREQRLVHAVGAEHVHRQDALGDRRRHLDHGADLQDPGEVHHALQARRAARRARLAGDPSKAAEPLRREARM